MSSARFLPIVAVSFLWASAADAQVVDFDESPLGNTSSLSFPGPFFVAGLSGIEVVEGPLCAPTCPDNGTRYVRTPTSGITGSLMLEGSLSGTGCAPDCSPFDLVSIDVAEASTAAGATQLSFVGTQAGGSSEVFVFVTDGVNDGPGPAQDFETVVLPAGFEDVDVVTILSDNPGFGVVVDNVVLGPIPAARALPVWGSAALVALLAGTAWASKRGWLRGARRLL